MGAQYEATPATGPRMRRASCMSLGWMVTRLAWMAHKLVSSRSCTAKSSVASCRASIPWGVHRKGSGAKLLVISRTCARCSALVGGVGGTCPEVSPRPGSAGFTGFTRAGVTRPADPQLKLTSLAKGSFRMRRPVVRWYLRISFRAAVPGLCRRLGLLGGCPGEVLRPPRGGPCLGERLGLLCFLARFRAIPGRTQLLPGPGEPGNLGSTGLLGGCAFFLRRLFSKNTQAASCELICLPPRRRCRT